MGQNREYSSWWKWITWEKKDSMWDYYLPNISLESEYYVLNFMNNFILFTY